MSMTDTQVQQDLSNLLYNRTASQLYQLLASEVEMFQLSIELAKNPPLPLSLQANGHTPSWVALKSYLKDGAGPTNFQAILGLAYEYLLADPAPVVPFSNQANTQFENAFYFMLLILFKSLLLNFPTAIIAPLIVTPVIAYVGFIATINPQQEPAVFAPLIPNQTPAGIETVMQFITTTPVILI